jgi:hypothetical protein
MAIRALISLSVLALSLSVIGCSMSDDVKEATETSKQMNHKMDGMATDTTVMKDTTSYLVNEGRKDLGFLRPDERYNDVLSAGGDTAKILEATALARSFAFQQWGKPGDTIPQREIQMAEAIRLLLYRFEPLIDHNYSPDTSFLTLPSVPSNEWRSAASMAVTLDEIDPDQQAAALKAGFPAESLYSLIVKGLQYKQKSAYTENIPFYAQQVLTLEKEAVLLLQLRHNYFLAMVMSRFSDYRTGDMEVTKSLHAMWNWTKVELGFPVNGKYIENVEKVKNEGLVWLQKAQETQQVLAKLGYPVLFNRGIQDIFQGFTMTPPAALLKGPMVEQTFSALDKVMKDLKQTYRTGKVTPGDIPANLIAADANLTAEELAQGIPKKE